jgi:hypothetical protein
VHAIVFERFVALHPSLQIKLPEEHELSFADRGLKQQIKQCATSVLDTNSMPVWCDGPNKLMVRFHEEGSGRSIPGSAKIELEVWDANALLGSGMLVIPTVPRHLCSSQCLELEPEGSLEFAVHLCPGAAGEVVGHDDDEWAATRGHTKDASVGPGTSAYRMGTTGIGHFVVQVWQTQSIPSAGFFSGAVSVAASLLLPDSAVPTSRAATREVLPDPNDTNSVHWEDNDDPLLAVRPRKYGPGDETKLLLEVWSAKSWSADPKVLAWKEVDLADFQVGNLAFGQVTNIMLEPFGTLKVSFHRTPGPSRWPLMDSVPASAILDQPHKILVVEVLEAKGLDYSQIGLFASAEDVKPFCTGTVMPYRVSLSNVIWPLVVLHR